MIGLSLSNFTSRRNQILERLQDIEAIALSLQSESTINTIKLTLRELENERFKLVVVGEFSRGKSTFINGMLGKRVLPSSPSPTTTILNKISYSESPAFQLVYRDGAVTKITEDEFHTIVAPEDPFPGDEYGLQQKNAKLEYITKIAYAEVGYPTELCKGGVEIVDTPGTNDLDAAREEITYRFIPQSDAAIILLSGKMPLAETEMTFIRDRIIASDIQKVFIVVNFKDALLTESDQQKVIRYIEEHIVKVFPNPRVYLVSAKQALAARRRLNGEEVKGIHIPLEETGYLELEQSLGTFLDKDRGRVKLLKPIERGIRLAEELKRNNIRLSLNSISLNLDELDIRFGQIKLELDRAEKATRETIESLRTSLVTIGIQIRTELVNGLHHIANSAVLTITEYNGTLQKEEIARAVENTVAPAQTLLQQRIRDQQSQLLGEELTRANRRLQREWQSVDNVIVQSLSLEVLQASETEGINLRYEEGEIAFKTGIGSFGLLGMVAGLHIAIPLAIPALLFGGSFLFNYFKNKTRDRVLGEVRVQIEKRYRDIIPATIVAFETQWNDVVAKCINMFQEEINTKLFTIRDQLDNIRNDRNREQAHVDRKKHLLMEQESQLNQIIADLQETALQLNIIGGSV